MTTIQYAMHVANQLQNTGKLESAEKILQCIIEVNPTYAYALHLLGVIAYQSGRIDSSIELIQQAIKNEPNIALFHSNLGEIYRQSKNFALSIEAGQRAVTLDKHSATALSNLGIAYYDAKRYEEAENCHKQALAIQPTLSSSLNNMGSIYNTYGKTPDAIHFYKAAIAASPQSIEFINNLGTLFLQQLDFKKALECFNQAILLAPTSPNSHCNIGLALLGLDQYDDALFYFKKTLRIKSHYPEAYYGIAKIYLGKHNHIEAERYISKAIAIHTQQVEFYYLLAEIYREQGKHSEALAQLDLALSIDSSVTSLYIGKGNILMEIGEIDSAEAQFLIAAEDPKVDTRILAHYCLIQLRKNKQDSQSLKELLSIVNNSQETTHNKLEYAYFALGKYYDDLGESAKAFMYFTQGCHLKRKRFTYNTAEQVQVTNKLINTFTKDTVEKLREFANPSALPIFIIGMPRSGTTLVEQIIASHPNVYGAGELTFFTDLIHSAGNNTQLSYPYNIPYLLPQDFHDVTQKYLSHLQRISSCASRITDKMPYNFNVIGLIHALFPNAKIIHVKRNPIDTCLSCYTKLFSQGHFYSYDLSELGHYYLCYEHIMNHWRSTLPSNAWLDIHYEDIIHNFKTEAKRLIAYVGLTWNPKCLAFYQSKRQVRTASFAQVRQPVYTSSVNRWRQFKNELAPLIQILNQAGMTQK